MPIKPPQKDETQSDWMARCVSDMMGPNKDKRPQDQAVAICMDGWREAHGGEKPKAVKPKRKLQQYESDAPIPEEGESESDYMARCTDEMEGDIAQGEEGEDSDSYIEQACEYAWENRAAAWEKRREMRKAKADNGKDDMPDPGDYDNYDDFLPDCLDAGYGEDECRTAYRDESDDGDDEEKRTDGLVVKTSIQTPIRREFVLSDESVDRMGDIIESAGWKLETFKKNPIALFSHRADFPIGKWGNLQVTKDKQLRGKLELAPKGTSPRIDELHALVDAGILRAVSVGFKPIKAMLMDPQNPFGGQRYLEHELIECSLVAVPANANALMAAKQLKISDETIGLVFAGKGNGHGTVRRDGHGGLAKRTPSGKTTKMTLGQRIKDAQARITGLQDKLTEHLSSVDDTNVSDAQLSITSELNSKIAQEEKGLGALVESEKHIAKATAAEHDNGGGGEMVETQVRRGTAMTSTSRPFNLPAKKQVDPLEYLVRAGTIQMYAHVHRMNVHEARQRIYGDDEPTKAVFEWAMRAATGPALSNSAVPGYVTGWAAELVQQVVSDFMQRLNPKSVFPRLSGMGLSLSFGRAGRIIIPTRALTPTIAGSFVGEGAPIPVRQGQFTSQTLTPKKMAVITVWTREIDEHSVPAIEGLLRQAVSDDTAVSIDSVLLDTNPATTIRPAGILNGVTPLTATAGGGFAALVGDIKQVTGALLTNTAGNVRSPAWIMNPQQVMSAGLTPAPSSGVFPFDTSTGQLQGWPIIDSGTVPLGTVIAIDAADFVAVGSEGPRFEISDQATLHMEDTTPLAISSGSPGTVASPVRSLWQTDSLALRLILPLNWAMRRTGVVSVINNVTW